MCVCARVCAATTVLKIKASRATVSFDGYVCVYVVCVCVRVFFSICVRACVFVHMCECVCAACVCMEAAVLKPNASEAAVSIDEYVCIYVCMFACMYVCV